MTEDPPEITLLLAEDDDGHATLIERNLARAGLLWRILRAHNGREALEWIEKANGEDRKRVVVLLDIRMPKVDGTEVLRRIKSDERTAFIPIYVLTTTDDQREIDRCFQLGCNAFITKPVTYDLLMKAIERLAWFLQISAVPRRRVEHS